MIADGNVLMYTAGTWYLLVPLLVGRKLYGEAVVRTVILADLLVSWFVWSHHLFAVIYALIPLLTKVEMPNNWLVSFHLWGWLVGALGMSYVMGWAGTMGMLRRTLYLDGIYQPYMIVALISALLMVIAFLCFLANIIRSLGWRDVVSLFIPEG